MGIKALVIRGIKGLNEMLRAVFLLVFLLYSGFAWAGGDVLYGLERGAGWEAEDTLKTEALALVQKDDKNAFSYSKLVLPSALIVSGSTGLYFKGVRSFNIKVRSGMHDMRQGRYFRLDDYLQYLPVASNLGIGFLGAKARHSFSDRLIITTASYISLGIMVNSLKYTICEMRPDGSRANSFPSGHTATAFMGAELVRLEYGAAYGAGAYIVAGAVGFLRVYNNRHWVTDVIAGAGVGILSARIGYWMLPFNRRLLGLNKKSSAPVLAACPSYDPFTGSYGAAIAFRF